MNWMLISGMACLVFGLIVRYHIRKTTQDLKKMNDAIIELKRTLGRTPTVQEIRDKLGISSDSIPIKDPCPPHAWGTNDKGYLQCARCGIQPTLKPPTK